MIGAIVGVTGMAWIPRAGWVADWRTNHRWSHRGANSGWSARDRRSGNRRPPGDRRFGDRWLTCSGTSRKLTRRWRYGPRAGLRRTWLKPVRHRRPRAGTDSALDLVAIDVRTRACTRGRWTRPGCRASGRTLTGRRATGWSGRSADGWSLASRRKARSRGRLLANCRATRRGRSAQRGTAGAAHRG